MKSSLRAPVLVLAGIATAILWGVFVLPATSVAGPMPGREASAFALVVVPPAAASALMLVGGLLGLRLTGDATGGRSWTEILAFGAAMLLGVACTVYTIVLLRAMV